MIFSKILSIVLLFLLLFSCSQKLNNTQSSPKILTSLNSDLSDFPIAITDSSSKITYKDSVHLLNFWRNTAVSNLELTNEDISNSELSELVNETFNFKGRFLSGVVYNSPNDLFKILVLKGESCGAYCNPFWESQIVNAKGEIINAPFFRNIDQIYLMSDGKYLVLQNSFGRPASVFTEINYSAILMKFKNKEISYFQFEYDYPKYKEIINDSVYNPSGKLSLSQEHFIEIDQYLTYDSNTSKIKYSFGTDFNYCCNVDSAFHYQGEFEYLKGKFEFLKEQKEYIEVE